jgi:hypothetical protein
VILIASEIDLENGDAKARVGQRYLALKKALEGAISKNPDSDFTKALDVIKIPEGNHLRKIMGKTRVLRELIKLSSEAFPPKSSLDPETLLAAWGTRVLGLLEKNSKNRFLGRNEQHLHSYREILRVFTQDPKKKISFLSERWENFSGGKPNAANDILSRRARNQLDRLQSTGFALEKGLSDFLSLKTLAFVAAAGLLGRVSQGLLVHTAGSRGSIGPRLLPLVKEGSLTGFGNFSAGLVTGTALSVGISGYQLAKDRQAERPEALSNFGRNLWWGLVTNVAALGISAAVMKASGLQAWAARPVEGGKTAQFFKRSLPYGLLHASVAGGGMLGANALARSLHNRGKSPEEKVPLASLEEAVETYLTMLSLTPADLLLQKPFMKTQLGPYRAREIEKMADTLLSQSLPKGISIQEWMTKTQSQALRGIPLQELKNQNFASLPSAEMSLEGEDLAIRLQDGRKFMILKESKGREGTQLGKEVYGKITDLVPALQGKVRVIFVGPP